MRIKKISQTTPIQAQVVDGYSTSANDSYSCNYVNGLNEYSTTEKRIGTWIDGKPLYRKTYYLKDVDIPKTNKVLLDFSDLNAETAFLKDDMSFWIDVSSTSTHTPMSVHLNQIISGTTDWQSTWLWDNKVYTRCGMVRKEDIYMTLEYTKTTDTV